MEEMLKKGIKMGRELITNGRIDSRKLQPGDHIFVNRILGSYCHHGIYVGDGSVIHYTITEKGNSNPKPPCPKCGYQENKHLGVVKSCLDCFISEDSLLTTGHSLHLYQYGLSSIEYAIKNPGSCSTRPSKPPEEVVNTATELYNKNGFGNYDIVLNNCEDFATFCKTGTRCGSQVDLGTIKTVAGVAIGAAALTMASIEFITKTREKKRNKSVPQNS